MIAVRYKYPEKLRDAADPVEAVALADTTEIL
jgi:hypothetical protein